jgi:hypothetical protein
VHFLVKQPEPDAPLGVAPVRADEGERARTDDRPSLATRADDGLAARLERIERLLEAGGRPAGGRADGAADPAALAVVKKALGEELDLRMAAFEAKLADGRGAKPPEPKKKRVNLSDAARELDLSAAEEAELRRIYTDAQEKYYRLIAGPDGDPEAIRREVEDARKDPKKTPMVVAKYFPKVLPKLPELMQVRAEQDAAVQAAVGADKAARLENGFDVIEANPLGTNELRVEARSR